VQTFSTESDLARRAIGAMFLFPFGGAWLAYYVFRVSGWNVAALVVVTLATVGLFALAYSRYKKHHLALKAESPSPAQKKADKLFNIINASQWIAIFIVGNVLNNVGLFRWFVPCIMLIVGLHFIPLARILRNPPHYFTGAALIAAAVAYPLLTPSGPVSAIGCLLAGVILWASALRAVLAANNSFKADGSAAA
jgi:hypothetical protein